MHKTSIVILTYGNLAYNKLCIESIRAFTPAESYEMIVVDNHSTDGTPEWLREQVDIRRIENGDNKGFAKGCNQGIAAAEPDNDILLLNNDTIVTPRWLENLQAALRHDAFAGAVGAVTNACSNFQQVQAPYKDWDGLSRFAEAFNRSDPSKWEERVRLIGFCLLIRRETINKIGLLDERFGKGNFEDDDYSLRIRQAGYRLLLCGDCFIHHFGSASFSKERQVYEELLRTNSQKFAEKWGVSPSLLGVDEREILMPHLRELAPCTVLVVNSAFGTIPLLLKKRYPQATICCVEADSRCAAFSPRGMETQDCVEMFEGRSFDLIVVLTHMRSVDFQAQLRALSDMPEAGGTLLILGDANNPNLSTEGLFEGCKREWTGHTLHIRCRATLEVKKEALPQHGQDLSAGPFDEKTLGILLRRVENHMEEEETVALLYKRLCDGAVSLPALKDAVLHEAVGKAELLNDFGARMYNAGKKEQALDLFIEGYKYDEQDGELAFNLAYSLAELGKTQEALAVIEQCQNPGKELLELRNTIGGAL
ncbi:MAG: glycosyltransferase family 2 protein [Ethanoligenens sp.]